MNAYYKDQVKLVHEPGDVLQVSPKGAKTVLTLQGIPILGSFERGDGKTGITHPCTPIFGPDRKNRFGLKQHGNMRNEIVTVTSIADSIMVSHTITDAGYPKNVIVKQIMSIEDGVFTFVMIHTNAGKEEVVVNAGEHCYFDAPQGYQGTKINGRDITQLIEENVDGIAIDLQNTNIIQIPGKPEIVLEQNGFLNAMIWVGRNPNTKAIDTKYVCIEPVEGDPTGNFFGSKKSKIPVGQSRSAMFSLQIKHQSESQ